MTVASGQHGRSLSSLLLRAWRYGLVCLGALGWATAVAAGNTAGALPSASASAQTHPAPGAEAQAQVLGQTDRLWVVRPAPGDTLAGLALRFWGRADRAWLLAESNGLADGPGSGAVASEPRQARPPPLSPDRPLVIARRLTNGIGFTPDGYQTVPILSYHRFGQPASAMVLPPEMLEAQLRQLASLGATVVPLSALADFLDGGQPLPAKSVVISVDDGHESFYRLAFPLLQKHGVPVTLFVPTDAVGQPEVLNWPQLQEMSATGLVSVQAHGKIHQSLVERAPGEDERTYRRALEVEVQVPRKLIEQYLTGKDPGPVDATVQYVAYPHGLANVAVLDSMTRNAFALGLSMLPGGNAFYTHPHMLLRTMVLGDGSLEAFNTLLQWRRALAP